MTSISGKNAQQFDLWGNGCNVACMVARKASPNSILITEETHFFLSNKNFTFHSEVDMLTCLIFLIIHSQRSTLEYREYTHPLKLYTLLPPNDEQIPRVPDEILKEKHRTQDAINVNSIE
jgi:hypothetical protein